MYTNSFYIKNRERIRKTQKKYYLTHKEEAKKRANTYYLNNRSNKDFKLKKNIYSKRWSRTPKGIYKVLKSNSAKKGRDMILSQNDFIYWYKQQEKKCYYCDIPEDKLNIEKIIRFTIDRLNNDMPYQLGNIVLACDWCNQIKGSILTESEMKIISFIIKNKWQKLLS